MSPSRRMQPVARVTREHADRAAQDYVACRQQLEAKQAQLQELLAYRDEYTGMLQHRGREGFTAAKIHGLNQFMTRLNTAIEQQQLVIETARAELEACRLEWLDKRQRACAIDKVIDRCVDREQREQARQEQRDSDECARQRLHRDGGSN